jgi:glucose-6-phosphate 1-dehydrogenase
MRFGYGEAFKASRYTGYEVMIYSCSRGDATLFSRGDLVTAAWQVAQPILDAWAATPATEFPNYARGSWGPQAAADLLERDGRRWYEVIGEEVLKKAPIFAGGDQLFLSQVSLALRSRQVRAGDLIIRKGDIGREMYLLARGEVEVLDDGGQVVKRLKDGDIFGEIAVLLSKPRTANVRAVTPCDLFVLDKADFRRILRDHQQFADGVAKVARERFNLDVTAQSLIGH